MPHSFTAPPEIQTRDGRIRDAQNAVIDRMRRHPETGQSSIQTSGRIAHGLTCIAHQGRFSATMDMSRGMGGDASAPSPGFFARAAIVGCVAIGVKMLAAREGLVFEAVDVIVDMDFDDSAIFGLSDRSAAPLQTRILIDLTTNHPEHQVRAIIGRVLEMDPWYMALRDPQSVIATVKARVPEPSGPGAPKIDSKTRE